MSKADALAVIDKVWDSEDESIHDHQYLEDGFIRDLLEALAKPETDLLGKPLAEASMWINAFRLVRPSEEFALEIGKDIIASLKVPGITLVRIAAT